MSISRYYFQLKNVLQIQRVFGLKKPILFTALSALNNLSGDQINIENRQTYRLIFYSFFQWAKIPTFWLAHNIFIYIFDQSKASKTFDSITTTADKLLYKKYIKKQQNENIRVKTDGKNINETRIFMDIYISYIFKDICRLISWLHETFHHKYARLLGSDDFYSCLRLLHQLYKQTSFITR